MIPHLHIRTATFLLAPILFASHSAHAQTPGPGTFSVRITEQSLPPLPPVALVRVTSGRQRLAFVAPRGFRHRSREGRSEVLLLSPADSCSLTLTLHPAQPATTPGVTPEAAAAETAAHWRATLLAKFPGAAVVEEFTQHSAGTSGPAFDLLKPNSRGGDLKIRSAFLPLGGQVIELMLVASAASFEQDCHAFSEVAQTLRAAEGSDPPAPELSSQL